MADHRTQNRKPLTASDERVAQIRTDASRFRARLRALWTEAGHAGDAKQVELCRLALGGDDAAADACARVLADAEGQLDEPPTARTREREYDWSPPAVRGRIVQLILSASVWAKSEHARADLDATGEGAVELDALLAFATGFAVPPTVYELQAMQFASAGVPPLARAAVRWADSPRAFADVCAAADEPRNEALCNLLICACLVARALRLEPASVEPDDAQAFRHLAAVALGKALCS